MNKMKQNSIRLHFSITYNKLLIIIENHFLIQKDYKVAVKSLFLILKINYISIIYIKHSDVVEGMRGYA